MRKTLRDEFAMAALMGDWAAQSFDTGIIYWHATVEDLVVNAEVYYRMADAMMKARTQAAERNEDGEHN